MTAIEGPAHRASERVGGERFGEIRMLGGQHAVLEDRVVGISGHEEDGEFLTYAGHEIGQNAPAHLRHDDIGQ